MYTLSSWRSRLGGKKVDIIHEEPAKTVGDPIIAYVLIKVTQVSRINNVHPKILDKTLGYCGFNFLHLELARTVEDTFTAYVPGEVT